VLSVLGAPLKMIHCTNNIHEESLFLEHYIVLCLEIVGKLNDLYLILRLYIKYMELRLLYYSLFSTHRYKYTHFCAEITIFTSKDVLIVHIV